MSLLAAVAAVLWCGIITCEFEHVVIPFTSTYAKKADAAKNAGAVAREMFGFDATNVDVYPIAEEESVSELVDLIAADNANANAEWSIYNPIIVQPYRAKLARDEQIKRERDEYDASLNDAGFLIGELTRYGYKAAYSKGGNVWCNASPDDHMMLVLGMRWSTNRKQWWRKTITEGAAQRTPLTRKEHLTAQSEYPYSA